MAGFGVGTTVAGFLLGVWLAPVGSVSLAAQGPPPPVPRPFPNSGASRPAEPGAPMQPTAPGPVEAPGSVPTSRPLLPDQLPAGVPVYPTAEFIDAYDAGAGQRYYLYGTNAAYADIVAYYRNTLKNGGRELFKTPPTQQFDLGRFDNNTMVFPPSVVVKDYTWNSSPGYLAVSGTTEKRFKTVIQVVPPTSVR